MSTKPRKLIKYNAKYVALQKTIVNGWNKTVKPGTPFFTEKYGRVEVKDKAFLLGGHTGYVSLVGKSAAVPLGILTSIHNDTSSRK